MLAITGVKKLAPLMESALAKEVLTLPILTMKIGRVKTILASILILCF